ncbi:minor tail protein [Microbacterium phage Schimmels22]|nr:minor tail protein [Microbacterium phage Schimmels22]
MGRAVVNTGSAGALVLDVNEVGYNVFENYSDVAWALYLDERVSSGSTWSGGGISATVGQHNVQQWWAGSFGFDWRPSGLQSRLIASGTNRVYHNPNGSGQVTVGANIGNTGTSGAGGPTQITNTIGLTQLTQVPGTPTGVSAVRVNDGQVNISWQNQGASNGQASQNQIEVEGIPAGGNGSVTINASGQASLPVLANEKKRYRVRAWNSAGWSGWSAWTPYLVTTPKEPKDVTATKGANLNITVAWTPQVAYPEHVHAIEHGVDVGGVITWDGTILATLPSGTSSYVHTAPNAAQRHVYRVWSSASNSNPTQVMDSAKVQSNVVQLLVAPNKPTFVNVPQFADRAVALNVDWQHNSVDSTPQSAYEFGTSTDGGTTWTSSGKVTSTVARRTIAANAYAANATVTMRVRTWGQATTGGSDGTGASPWSDLAAVTFKTKPTVTISSPANSSTVNDATLRVNLTFAQAQSASFVKAQLELLQGSTLLETRESNILLGITMQTRLQNGVAYTIRARVQDSNGIWSTWASNAFSVTYLAPVPAQVTPSYVVDKGWGQLDLTIPAPGSGQAAVTKVTITRAIDGGTPEIIVQDYPYAAALTFLDTLPTIHGTNTYVITTYSALGAQTAVTSVLVTEECRRAFLSKGPGFSEVGAFGANLKIDESVAVASGTVEAAGRVKPIGLYGVETTVQLKVKSFVFEGFGSTLDELRTILLIPGKACYRDATGRRVFGVAKGSISREKVSRGDLSFTMTETS